MTNITELINGLNRAITPANGVLQEIEVQLTAQSFSNALVRDVIQRNGLPQEIFNSVDNIASAILFAKAISFGYPKELPPGDAMAQVIYGNSTLAFYFEELKRYVASIPGFIEEFLQTTIDYINAKVSEAVYSKVAYSILDYISIIQTLASAADLENQQIPSEYSIISEVRPYLDQLTNQIIAAIQNGDAYRIAFMNHQPTNDLEQTFIASVKTANETIQKQVELYGLLQQKILDSFMPSFNEEAYIHFQQYAQQYSSSVASICLLSLKIGMYSPSSLQILAQVLERMAKFGYDIFAPVFNIMRFRDKFEKAIEDSKTAHESIGQFFAPLLQSLVQIQPDLPIPFQNVVNTQLVPLFETLQRLNIEYDQEMDKLIAAMKQDRKFSVFQTLGQLAPSELSEAAKPTMEIAGRILSQILKTGATIEDINENIQSLNTEYSEFSAFVQIKLNHLTNADQKAKLIQQRDAISKSLLEFVDGFKLFILNQNNVLLRNKVGILTANFLFALCCLDTSNPIIKQLVLARQLLADNVVRFYPNNMKTLVDTCMVLNKRKEELPLETRQQFIGVYSVFMDSIRQSANVFSSNSNSTNPQNVISCVKESDKLKSLLKALHGSLNNPNIPQDILPLINELEVFSYDISGAPQTFRLALQLNYKHCVDAFTQYMGPFIDMITSAATVQSEQYYQHFCELKNIINEGIKAIQEKLNNPPPFGIYDRNYILGLIAASRDVFKPSFELLKESQEILKHAQAPAQLKAGINSITQTLTLLAQLMTYVGSITTEGELPMNSLIGFLLKDTTNDVENKINMLKQVMNDPTQVSQVGQQLISSLYEYADALEKVEQLKPLAEQLRIIANSIGDATARIASGDTSQIPVLNQMLDNILGMNQQLKPVSDKLISEVQSIGGEVDNKKKQEEEEKRKEQLQKEQQLKEEEESKKPKYEQFIDHIPNEDEIEKMFIDVMQSENESIRPLLSKNINALKEDVDEFKKLFEQYRNDPNNKDVVDKLKEIAQRIQQEQEQIKKGLEFIPPEEIKSSSLLTMFDKLKQYNNEEKAKETPQILMNLAQYINENYKDPVKLMLSNLVGDISMLMKSNPKLAYSQLETLINAINGNPEEISLQKLEKLKETLKKNPNNKEEVHDLLQQALFANLVQKLMSGQSNPLDDPDSVQSKLHRYVSNINQSKDGNGEEVNGDFDLAQLIDQLEDMVIGTDDVQELDSEQISDKIMDLNSEVVSLGTEISNDLKKATEANLPEIQKKVNLLRSKALELSNISLIAASKRGETNKDTSSELQEESTKLLELLNSYSDIVSKVPTSSNKNAQIRAVNKANREINMALGHIAELADEIVETPVSVIQPSSEDYHAMSNQLMGDIFKLAQLSTENSSAKPLKFGKVCSSLNLGLQKFIGGVKTVTKGAEEQEDILGMINDLQGLFGQLTEDASSLTTDIPTKLSKLVNDIRVAVSDSLNTEVVPQPKVANSLPFRFKVPTIPETSPTEIAQLQPIIDNKQKLVKSSLEKLISSLNGSKTSAEQIQKEFNEFQTQLSELIIPTSNMQTSTWNPQCQNQLLKARNALINAGDICIDATRNRLMGSEGWRDSVAAFLATAETALEQTMNAVDATIKSAEADLSVTNEVEKELVIAARACQSSMQRLMSLKSTAAEKKLTIGDNYLGCDIIEVSAPILNNAAKLIEVAQAQTKFVLQKNPEIINQKGLINTANNLVDSLELITVAAEATVNNEPDAMPKILAGCNLISQAVAHFLVENNQKGGSPELNVTLHKMTDSVQNLIKQLRQFAETAMDAEKKAQQKSVAGGIAGARRPLSGMIAKLNAEAKVVAARKALEEAEKLAKEARQGK
ncbi:hypothetical protein GPJ56_009329 [Histomonas meleagridis]|uniref:uncharacterized protein n=1 Tax=Histomonas meleagridis TaxID=135588 RepID=UPI003559B5B6|nr:hypothetical protein GPJ56_009329 [Histomonas meleagridis]KAH0797743.1 hypothetical protein GO595_009372 [Histomonas meleagridis]